MAAVTDFWGNINTEEVVRTPVSILKEQAALLGKKTKNVLEAKVDTIKLEDGWFGHRLFLVAPTLDNYTYELLRFCHPIQLYPVLPDSFRTLASWKSSTTPPTEGTRLPDEDAFLRWLSGKLSSDETHRVITNLLSQSMS